MRNKPETISFWRGKLPHWEVAEGRYFVTIRLKGAIPAEGLTCIKQKRQRLDRAVDNGQDALREHRAVFREMERWLDRADGVDHLRNPQVARAVMEAIHHREHQGVWTVFDYVLMPNHCHLFFRLGPVGATRRCGASPESEKKVGAARRCGALPESEKKVGAARRCGALPESDGWEARKVAQRRERPTGGSAERNTPERVGRRRERPTGAQLSGSGFPSQSGLKPALEAFKHWTAREAKRLLGLGDTRFWQREWFDHWSRSAQQDEDISHYIQQNPVKAGLVRTPGEWPFRFTRTK